MSDTVDFGAPSDFGTHHFHVLIPAGPRDAVQIIEDFGFDGDEIYKETELCRIVLARELWTKIRDEARREFNARLKQRKMAAGSWRVGKTRMDRFLGRELCVLAWAAEHAKPEECGIICQKWLALRPEERWWLYSKTAAEAGEVGDTLRGWRKALYCALSDAESMRFKPKVAARHRKKTTLKDQQDFGSLFGAEEGL